MTAQEDEASLYNKLAGQIACVTGAFSLTGQRLKEITEQAIQLQSVTALYQALGFEIARGLAKGLKRGLSPERFNRPRPRYHNGRMKKRVGPYSKDAQWDWKRRGTRT